ncbi:hypothetical protein [Candidatus Synechococcus spongiarum]|uniref:hypothetical protein n=1 Tax=Candidatus Synechococcus spongiarum TaxID=431041 RepID=UPI00046FD8E7|nr:hypothetical protein [Candidatus Synechococcus spongiarum]
MVRFAPLLPLLVSAMPLSPLAMAADCGPTPPAPDAPAPWIRSWMSPALLRRFDPLPSPEAHQNPAPDSSEEQPLAATGQGDEPAFCPI